MTFRRLAVLTLAALLLAACGGGADRTKAQVRLVNASSGYAELDLRVADQLRQGAVGYGAAAAYVELDPGSPASTIARAGSATALLSLTPALSKNKHYTVLAYGVAGALNQRLLDDDTGAPEAGRALLRVVNAAPDAGAVDIYLTAADEPLAASVPVQAGAAVGAVGEWLTVTSAGWRLRITAAGSKADLRLDLPTLTLESKQVATLVLTPGRGGVLLNTLLLTQQGAITRRDSTHARVRAAAGLADGGAVSAAAGGTVLMATTGSPAVGLYALVAAGAQPVALAVNGTPLAAAPVALVAGGDYTLLVHGELLAPRASWIEDDNRLPADSGKAKLRLVNGTAALATPLAMTVDFVPVADNVEAGAASGYALVGGTTAARLSVTAAGLPAPLFNAIDQQLDAGANYSVFVVGRAATAVGILRKDR